MLSITLINPEQSLSHLKFSNEISLLNPPTSPFNKGGIEGDFVRGDGGIFK
jgi:hypothetical protein